MQQSCLRGSVRGASGNRRPLPRQNAEDRLLTRAAQNRGRAFAIRSGIADPFQQPAKLAVYASSTVTVFSLSPC
jgi:hypothetical protein